METTGIIGGYIGAIKIIVSHVAASPKKDRKQDAL